MDSKTDDFNFVVGLEILDNMPHDRLYSANHRGVSADEEELTHVSTVLVEYAKAEDGTVKERLEEQIVELKDISDPAIELFLYLWQTQQFD